jgi:hypothetical protein
MEEHNMSQSNQFSPIDILALSNFEKARKIMDRTMWEGVSAKFEGVAGGVTSPKAASTQFRKSGRYIMYVGHGKGWQFDIVLGYSLGQEGVAGYPQVGVWMDVNPNAAAHAAIVSAMEDYAKRKGNEWKTWGLADEHKWGCMGRTKGLQEFLSEEDQVKKVVEYFEGLLKDVKEFKALYPNLPWNPQKTDQEET